MSVTKDESPGLKKRLDHWFGELMSRLFGSPVKRKNAEDCLPSDKLDQLRVEVVGKPLSDDVAELISAGWVNLPKFADLIHFLF